MVEANTARSACFRFQRPDLILESQRPGALDRQHPQRIFSVEAGGGGLGQKARVPTLSIESVPRPTRRPARRKAASGAAPWPCVRFERGQ